MSYHNTLEIIEDSSMVSIEIIEVKRTVKERLFSIPWRPLNRIKKKSITVPSKEVIKLGYKIIVHPSMGREIESLLNSKA